MTAPIRRRLDALERSGNSEVQSPFIVITRSGREPVGIAAPHPLPDVLRLPGETWDALMARTAAQFRGLGPAVVFAQYADNGATSCAR